MDEIARTVREIEPVWDDLKEQRLLNRIHDQLDTPEEPLQEEAGLLRKETERWPTAVLALVATASLVAGAWAWLSPAQVAVSEPSRVELHDGSVLSFAAGSEVAVVRDHADVVIINQANGDVHYEVTPNPSREFHVEAGHVRVSVLGTAFDVSMDDSTVRVRVERGRVSVSVQGRQVELTQGEEFSSSASELTASDSGDTRNSAEPTTPRGTLGSDPPGEATVDTRDENDDPIEGQEGELGAATPQHEPSESGATDTPLVAPPPTEVTATEVTATEVTASEVTATEEMARVDEARARGDYATAAALLRSLLARGSPSGERVTGWFTLGRLEARQGHHAAAANAFLQARSAAPSGALALDALAQEALARERSGERAVARQLATEYLRRAPSGHHESVMQGLIE